MSRTTIGERHECHVTTDAPEGIGLWATAKGHNPMTPDRILITYDLTGQCPTYVEVIGIRAGDEGHPYGRRTRRRVRGTTALAAAPDWLREVVERYAAGRPCEARAR